MNDHRRLPGDRRAEQNSAYGLVWHLKIKQRSSLNLMSAVLF